MGPLILEHHVPHLHMNIHIQELIIVAVVMDVVGIDVFPQHLLQIVFKVSSTSDTRLGIAEFRDE